MDSPHPAPDAVSTPEQLARKLADLVCPSTAIVCIGNELRGDDGAGPAVARRLTGRVPWVVYDAQTAPENFLVKVASGQPASVLLIDAVHFGGRVGQVALLSPDELAEHTPSTHGPAPTVFLAALSQLHPCPCAVLGIQPQQVETGRPLSGPVSAAVTRVVAALRILARACEQHGPDQREGGQRASPPEGRPTG